MKKVLLLMVLSAALMFGGAGCEQITPEQVQNLANQQQVLQEQADTIQKTADQLAQQLAAGGIIDPNTVAKIVKLNKEADRIQGQVNTIAMALQNVKLTGDTNVDWLAIANAFNNASAGWNPYAAPIGIGLGLLGYILTWVESRKKKQAEADAAAAKAKYQAHKAGVELTMKEVSASTLPEVKAVEAQLYNNIGSARAANKVA